MFSVFARISCLFVFAVLPLLSQYAEGSFTPQRSTPRSLGVAEAVVAAADDAAAFVVNPAGISRHASQRRLALNGHFEEKANEYNISTSVLDGLTEDPLHWGFRFQHESSGLSKFQDYALGLSSAFNRYLMLGTSQHLSHFGKTLQTQKMWAYTFHAGALILLNDYFALGFSVENPYRFKKLRAMDPFVVRSGASLNLEAFRFLLQHDWDSSNQCQALKTGMEWRALRALILRGGFFHEFNKSLERVDSLPRGYSLGFSLEPDRHFSFDFAFLDQLRSSQRFISMGVSAKI